MSDHPTRADIDLLEGSFYVDDPGEKYAWMRANAPVYFDAKGGVWGFASYAAVLAASKDPKTFSRPWTIEMPLYRLIDDNVQILEHKCVPFADKLLYSDLMHLEPQQKNAPDPKTFRERTQ